MKINMRLVKPSKEGKMEITGNWRGDNDQISKEKQISSDNVNMQGEHVTTIELGYFSSFCQLFKLHVIVILLAFGILSKESFFH